MLVVAHSLPVVAGTPWSCFACHVLLHPAGELLAMFKACMPVIRCDIQSARFLMPYLLQCVISTGSTHSCKGASTLLARPLFAPSVCTLDVSAVCHALALYRSCHILVTFAPEGNLPINSVMPHRLCAYVALLMWCLGCVPIHQ